MNRILLLILGITLLTSCRDVFENDIEDRKVDVLFPQNKERVTDNTVKFVWEEMDGADEYVINIVANRFTDVDDYLLKDTILEGLEFSYSFPYTGDFEWSIQARNGGYNSLTEYRILYVDSVYIDSTNMDSTTQSVGDTIAPGAPHSLFTNVDSTDVNFGWSRSSSDVSFDSIYISKTNTFSIINFQDEVYGTTFNYSNIDTNQMYYWKLKSIDTAWNESTFSVVDSFFVN